MCILWEFVRICVNLIRKTTIILVILFIFLNPIKSKVSQVWPLALLLPQKFCLVVEFTVAIDFQVKRNCLQHYENWICVSKLDVSKSAWNNTCCYAFALIMFLLKMDTVFCAKIQNAIAWMLDIGPKAQWGFDKKVHSFLTIKYKL